MPLAGREYKNVKEDTINDPEGVQREMPPARQADRVPETRNAQPPRQGHGVVLRGPGTIARNGAAQAKELRLGPASGIEGQSRMVREDLKSRPDDEEHQEQIEIVLIPKPPRKACRHLRPEGTSFRIIRDERLHGWQRPQVSSDEDTCDANHQTDDHDEREQLAKRKPAAAEPELRHRRHLHW